MIDWFEKWSWDLLADRLDDGTGEIDQALGDLDMILQTTEMSTDDPVGYVHCDEATCVINLNPWRVARFLYADGSPNLLGYYRGFYLETVHGVENGVLHELRHIWQLSLSNHGVGDADQDGVFAPGPLPESSADLLDDFNVDSGQGESGDGHFLLDLVSDDHEAVKTMHEHNAMRFTHRLGEDSDFECAYSSIEAAGNTTLSGPAGQYLPDPIEVRAKWKTGPLPADSAAGAGVTVRFSVLGGCDAQVDGSAQAWSMTQGGPSPVAGVEVRVGSVECTILAEVVPPMAPPGPCNDLTGGVTFTVTPQ